MSRANWWKSRAQPGTDPSPTSLRPRRTHPAAGCRTFEELLQREQERGYKPGWARHVWAARQRSA